MRVMRLGRRGFLAASGSSLLLAGCSTFRAPDPPAEPDNQLRAGESAQLTGDEGIVCGVGISAWMHRIERGRRDSNGEDRPYRFLFGRLAGSGPVRPLYIARATPRGRQEDDGFVATETTPFAYRLPEGVYAVALLQIYDLAYIPAAYQPRVYAWSRRPIPPLTFTVRPGEVSYIGRLGLLQGVTNFPTRAQADAACQEPDYAFTTIPVPAGCSFRRFVFASMPDNDLPLIRQRFPALEPVRIATNPAQGTPGGWADWAEARRDPMTTRAGAFSR